MWMESNFYAHSDDFHVFNNRVVDTVFAFEGGAAHESLCIGIGDNNGIKLTLQCDSMKLASEVMHDISSVMEVRHS